METTQHADNSPTEKLPIWKEQFYWRRCFFGALFILPITLLITQFTKVLAGTLVPSSLESDLFQSIMRGCGTVFGIVYLNEFVERDRKRNATDAQKLASLDDGESPEQPSPSQELLDRKFGQKLPFSPGEVPFALRVQALITSALAYSLFYLFLAWLFNLLPVLNLPYLSALAYGSLVAGVGSYGKRAERALKIAYSWNKEAFWDRSGKPREVVEWSELRTSSIATTLCIGIAYFSLYKAFVEDRPTWAWGVVCAFVILVLFFAVLFLWSGFEKRQDGRDERHDSLL